MTDRAAVRRLPEVIVPMVMRSMFSLHAKT